MGWRGGNLFQHVIAFDQFTEDGVLMIELSRTSVANEELASGRIWIRGPRHRNGASHMGTIIELGLDGITRTALSPGSFLGRILCIRISSLNHEILDYPVKTCPIIKSFSRQRLEIFDGLRCYVG